MGKKEDFSFPFSKNGFEDRPFDFPDRHEFTGRLADHFLFGPDQERGADDDHGNNGQQDEPCQEHAAHAAEKGNARLRFFRDG